MTIRAYDEEYLAGAQRILGDAVDFAVMTLGVELDVLEAAEENEGGVSQNEAAEMLLSLSRTLCCRMEDLMER